MASIISTLFALAKHVTIAGWADVGDAYRAPPELTTGILVVLVACLVLFVSFPAILVAWIVQNRRRFSAGNWFTIAGLTAVFGPGITWFGFRNNTVPTALFLAIALIPLFVGLRKKWLEGVRTMRTRLGRCPECDYDLTGNVSGVCPECGEEVEAA